MIHSAMKADLVMSRYISHVFSSQRSRDSISDSSPPFSPCQIAVNHIAIKLAAFHTSHGGARARFRRAATKIRRRRDRRRTWTDGRTDGRVGLRKEGKKERKKERGMKAINNIGAANAPKVASRHRCSPPSPKRGIQTASSPLA